MIALGIDGKLAQGVLYELGGPKVMNWRQILTEILEIIHRKRCLISLPFSLAIPLGGVLALLGKLPLIPTLATAQQMQLLKYDSIVSDEAIKERRTLEGVGIIPQASSAILASYLWRFRVQGQFAKKPHRP